MSGLRFSWLNVKVSVQLKYKQMSQPPGTSRFVSTSLHNYNNIQLVFVPDPPAVKFVLLTEHFLLELISFEEIIPIFENCSSNSVSSSRDSLVLGWRKKSQSPGI